MKGAAFGLLCYAAEHDNMPAFEAILKTEGFDVTQINAQGKNLLHLMAEKNQVDLAKLCLKKLEGEGGDKLKMFINCPTKKGEPGNTFLILP